MSKTTKQKVIKIKLNKNNKNKRFLYKHCFVNFLIDR